MNYVYLIYNDIESITSFSCIPAKVGRGSGNRYKQYTTYYGKLYKVCILYSDDYIEDERKLLGVCRLAGYIQDRSEIIHIPIDRSMSIDDHISAYRYTINMIISYMRLMGTVHTITNRDPLPTYIRHAYIRPIEEEQINSIEEPIDDIDIDLSILLLDDDDLSVYTSYVDPQWNGYMDTYTNVWCKSRNIEIKCIASLYRHRVGIGICNDDKIAIPMLRSLKELFRIGGCDLDSAIDSMSSNVALRYSSIHSDDVRDLLVMLGDPIRKIPNRYIWVWLHNYLCQHLLVKCDKKVKANSKGDRIYTYNIDLTDWIYYHIRSN